jgi:hypothetical protein
MNKSESIAKLAVALVKAQAEMPNAPMDGVNPFFKSKYATLGSVIDTAKTVLSKHGLAVSQPVVHDGGLVGIETILIHESGEWISSICCIPLVPSGKTAQEAGAIISYLRRYGLASILGMYSDEDLDGNQKPTKAPVKVKQEIPAGGKVETMTLEQAEAFVSSDGIKYGDIPAATLSRMYNAMEKKLNADGYDNQESLDLAKLKMQACKILMEKK